MRIMAASSPRSGGSRPAWFSRLGVLAFAATLSCGDGSTEPARPPPRPDPPRATTLTVTPATASLVAFGDTLRLTAAVLDQNGRPMAGAAVAWSSGNGAVATVDASGLVTGVAAGEVEITATSSGVTGSAALTVVDPAPTTVAVAPDTAALTALGQTAQLSAEVRDQAGRAMDGVPVSWSSADTVVAAVDSVGLVTAVGGGTTTVAATAGDASGEAAVTVMQSASSVAVTPSAATVGPGDTLRLVAEAFDENGHAVAGAVFDWMSSDGSVATVTDSGLVRGRLGGHGHDQRDLGRCPGNRRSHRGEPRPGGTSGALRRDRRAELARQHRLADRCAAGGLVRRGDRRIRTGRPA